MKKYDAILIPGGGIRHGNKLSEWSKRRFDKALELYNGEYIMPLSAGTTHKPPIIDDDGYLVYEADVGANYLVKNGIKPEMILKECSSYDTIGNAYFARVIHTDPAGFRKLLVITSEFHMKRVKEIFEWMFSIDSDEYQLDFLTASDDGIASKILEPRYKKEKKQLEHVENIRSGLMSLNDVHRWLYSEHKAYMHQVNPVREKLDPDKENSSY